MGTPTNPEPEPAPSPPAESPDGVDLTLIRWTLSLAPLERLELLLDPGDERQILGAGGKSKAFDGSGSARALRANPEALRQNLCASRTARGPGLGTTQILCI